MDVRPDTSSGRSQDGWSFLNQATAHNAQARSQPPSSYLRSDRSSISPLPNSHFVPNGSRSSLSRLPLSASTGARSTTTIPSQPVLSRIHSANASNHNNQFPIMNRRPMKIDNESGLPAREEFSIQGILDAIHEDVEGYFNTVAEILGRERFMLADQHEAQMPPQGEILLEQELATGIVSATEGRPGDDNVIILNEDASLVDGSNSGSAAYGLIETLQVVPRPARMNSDAAALMPRTPEMTSPVRTHSSPAAIQAEQDIRLVASMPSAFEPRQRSTGVIDQTAAPAVVSETFLVADADGVNSGTIPSISEVDRYHPRIAHIDTDLHQDSLPATRRLLARRRFGSWAPAGASTLVSWFATVQRPVDQDAEARLRRLLNR